MEIRIDVESAIKAALEKSLSEGMIAKEIEMAVTNTVCRVIRDETETYSQFGMMLKNEIKSLLPQSVSMENQSNFRDSIMKTIQSNLSAYKDEHLEARINGIFTEILLTPPKSIKLSELVTSASKMWKTSKPTVHVIESVGITKGYINVHLDERYGVDKYSCSCSIAISSSGQMYSTKIGNQDVKQSLFVGPFYDFERFLFWLYTGGTIVEIDRTDFSDFDFPETDGDEDD